MTESRSEKAAASSAETDVGRRTFRAAIWGLIAATGKRVLNLVGLTLLARLLAPHDFGLIGFAMIYLSLVEVVGDLGTTASLVYWPERREDATQITFLVNVVSGLVWSLITLAMAPLIAQFFHAPHGVAILRVLSLTTILSYLGKTHDALAQKDLRFRERSLPELALTGVKAIVALLLAFLGFGVWSLVWGHLAGVAASTVLYWVIIPWRPTRERPRDLLGPMLRYGRSIVAWRIMSALMLDLDVIVVGRFLGVTALGLYQMGARIPESTVMVLIWVSSQALFPALSRVHAEGGDVRRAYLTATRCVFSVTLPAALGLSLLARPIILAFFGPHWEPSAIILSMLAISVGFRSIDYDIGNVLRATGRTNTGVALTVIKGVMLVPGMLIAAQFSAAAVAGTLAAINGIGTLILTAVAGRLLDIPLKSMAAAFARPVAAALPMCVVLAGWLRLSGGLPVAARLAAGLLIGAVAYLGVLRLVDPQIFGWARRMALSDKNAASDELLRAV